MLQGVFPCRHLRGAPRSVVCVPDRFSDQTEAYKKKLKEAVGDAPQFDDITMLALRYNGALDSAKELTVDAVRENFDRVYDFLDSFLNGFDCSPEKKIKSGSR